MGPDNTLNDAEFLSVADRVAEKCCKEGYSHLIVYDVHNRSEDFLKGFRQQPVRLAGMRYIFHLTRGREAALRTLAESLDPKEYRTLIINKEVENEPPRKDTTAIKPKNDTVHLNGKAALEAALAGYARQIIERFVGTLPPDGVRPPCIIVGIHGDDVQTRHEAALKCFSVQNRVFNLWPAKDPGSGKYDDPEILHNKAKALTSEGYVVMRFIRDDRGYHMTYV